jgi:hypothetical protein
LKPELSCYLKNVDDIASIDYYNLNIAVDNDGETTVWDLRVNIEIPHAHMEVGASCSAEVASMMPLVAHFFKYPVEESSPGRLLDPGERKSICTLMLGVRKEQYLGGTNDVISQLKAARRVTRLAQVRALESPGVLLQELTLFEGMCGRVQEGDESEHYESKLTLQRIMKGRPCGGSFRVL